MIDFRYHLVSLISVFLALAVGIALGAGPLEQSIGDTLTGQVDVLREEKDTLRAELDATSADLARAQQALDAVAPALLSGVLGQRRVAVVEVGDVEAEVTEAVASRIEQAGGTVSGVVRVAEAWVDPEQRSTWRGVTTALVDLLDPVPPGDAETEVRLAEALVQSLTSARPGEPDTLTEDAVAVLMLLTGEAGLVTVEREVTAPADAVVVLAGPTASGQEGAGARAGVAGDAGVSPAPQDPTAEGLAEARLSSTLAIATAAQNRSGGAVVAAGGAGAGGVLDRLRQDEATGTHISTVEAVHSLSGQISVPLALANRVGGMVGHYGPSETAGEPMPPHVVLPTVERAVVDPGLGEAGAPGDAEVPTDPEVPTEPGLPEVPPLLPEPDGAEAGADAAGASG